MSNFNVLFSFNILLYQMLLQLGSFSIFHLIWKSDSSLYLNSSSISPHWNQYNYSRKASRYINLLAGFERVQFYGPKLFLVCWHKETNLLNFAVFLKSIDYLWNTWHKRNLPFWTQRKPYNEKSHDKINT